MPRLASPRPPTALALSPPRPPARSPPRTVRTLQMSSPQLKVRASELQNKKRDELVKQLEELKTELVSLRVQKIAGGNASKLARM